MTEPVRWAVLASGSGTNFQALIDADLGPGQLVRLVTNLPGCGAAERAGRHGIPVTTVEHRGLRRAAFDANLVEALQADRVDWVVLAGFMRILSPTFLASHPRTLNIHPSLLPAFPGLDAQRQAFEAGVRITGCTVHMVDAGIDTGPVLAQVAVPVLEDDDAESLRLRILEQEHQVLPAVVRAVSEGRLDLSGPRPRWVGSDPSGTLLHSPDLRPLR